MVNGIKRDSKYDINGNIMRKVRVFCFLVLFGLLGLSARAETLRGFDERVRVWATEAATRCAEVLESAIDRDILTENQVFDTLYMPVPDTYPQKFSTAYDSYTDEHISPIQEKYLAKDSRLVFVVLVDRNGYLPTHNIRYCKPLTGDRENDLTGNRTKRIFNDKTGFTAARNTEPFLLQTYKRDTGEIMKDLSVPVRVKGRQWGAIRFGYREEGE